MQLLLANVSPLGLSHGPSPSPTDVSLICTSTVQLKFVNSNLLIIRGRQLPIYHLFLFHLA
jgi:hypothetical protein